VVTVASSQRWRKKGETVFWTVVSISSDQQTIGLSGPGPCRGMRYVTPDDLESDWEQVR